jgi:hypothetical protein
MASSSTSVLNGPFKGYSPKQTYNNKRDSEQTRIRRVLVKGWNTAYANGKYNNHNRVVTPFRAINSLGDFLARENYSCGGPYPIQTDRYKRRNNARSMFSNCDNTGVPGTSCNPKFVSDSSDYTTFKKQVAINQNYNDSSFGGDDHNGSYVSLMAARRR